MPGWAAFVVPQGALRALSHFRSRLFDLLHGIETSERRSLADLTLSGSQNDAAEYQPTDLGVARDALAALDIRHEDFTLLDLGSGKGRVLCLATKYPFREIVGLEFARELNDIAERNLANYRFTRRLCRQVSTRWADAIASPWPDTALVVFLFNPFRGSAMQALLARLSSHPHPVVVVAVSWSRQYFDASDAWVATKKTPSFTRYRRRKDSTHAA